MTYARSKSELIVDFPSRTAQSEEIRCFQTKCVRFVLSINEERLIDYPSKQENHAKWYSKVAYSSFRKILMRDVVECSDALSASNTPQDITRSKERIVRCIGLDHLISRNIPERTLAVKEARRCHTRTVLKEHKRQRRNHVEWPESLARVSMASSAASRERSYKVAALSAAVNC